MGLVRSVAKKMAVAAAMVVGKRVVSGVVHKLRQRLAAKPPVQKPD